MLYVKGAIYYIKFYDHCLTDTINETITCEVVGWCINEDKVWLTLSYWNAISSTGCVETEKSNKEYIQILKSSIIKHQKIALTKRKKVKNGR